MMIMTTTRFDGEYPEAGMALVIINLNICMQNRWNELFAVVESWSTRRAWHACIRSHIRNYVRLAPYTHDERILGDLGDMQRSNMEDMM
jgi:hypothetical protein